MTPNEYQALAFRTAPCPDSTTRSEMHGVFGLTSEAGEVAALYQKVYQGREIDREHLKKELGDCIWMIAEICTANGFELEDVMETNIKKLEARFPNHTFNVYQDSHRSEDGI